MSEVATTVRLIRHAVHDRVNRVLCGRMEGVSLGHTGLADAHRLAERMAAEPIAAVQSSPLERTRETAEIIAQRLGLAAEVAPPLLEIDFGRWTGKSFEELATDTLWQRWNHARSQVRAPGGETMHEVQSRVVRHIEATRIAYPGRTVVLVSHGDVIRAALLHYLCMSIDDYHRLEIAPCSSSVVFTWGTGAKVLGLNEVVR